MPVIAAKVAPSSALERHVTAARAAATEDGTTARAKASEATRTPSSNPEGKASKATRQAASRQMPTTSAERATRTRNRVGKLPNGKARRRRT